jgi:serine/threonine protein kinase
MASLGQLPVAAATPHGRQSLTSVTPPAGGLSSSSAVRRSAEEPDEPPPFSTVGKYLVLETLARTRHGLVLHALHTTLLTDVVLKLVSEPWAVDEERRHRLIAEAQALAAIEHPHLARVLDLEFEGDRPYVVLEYVAGQNLRQGQLQLAGDHARSCRLLAKVARAVAVAHRRGVLHLDLKPENILLTPAGEPVLIDFGMAYLSRLRRDGRGHECIAGTPAYMAPEQFSGLPESLGPFTDVFGIGAVLFFLLTGRDPFAPDPVEPQAAARCGRCTASRDPGASPASHATPATHATPECPASHAADGSQRQSATALAEGEDAALDRLSVAPAEPPWELLRRARVARKLRDLCRRALAPHPESRIASAEELADELDQVSQRLERYAQRRQRGRIAALGLLGLLLVAASLGLSWLPSSPRNAWLAVQVARAGHDLDLSRAVPVRTSDVIRVEGSVEECVHPVLLVATSDGQLRWLRPSEQRLQQGAVHFAYPSFSEYFQPASRPIELLVMLVSCGPRSSADAELAALWDAASPGPEQSPLPGRRSAEAAGGFGGLQPSSAWWSHRDPCSDDWKARATEIIASRFDDVIALSLEIAPAEAPTVEHPLRRAPRGPAEQVAVPARHESGASRGALPSGPQPPETRCRRDLAPQQTHLIGKLLEPVSRGPGLLTRGREFGEHAVIDALICQPRCQFANSLRQPPPQPSEKSHHQESGPQQEEQARRNVELHRQDLLLMDERVEEEVLADAIQHEGHVRQEQQFVDTSHGES